MSIHFIRLPDMSIVKVPTGHLSKIPKGIYVIDPRITSIITEHKRNNKSTDILHYTDIIKFDFDPFGIKKPIPSSNRKY